MNPKYLYGRVRIDMNAIIREREIERQKKLLYYRRMKAMGVRGTSIQKYLRRGFPGAFVKAIRKEVEQMIVDMNRAFRRLA